jgi:hypothetical protein
MQSLFGRFSFARLYFQIKCLDGEFEEVSWLSVFGNGRTGKRRAA